MTNLDASDRRRGLTLAASQRPYQRAKFGLKSTAIAAS
jgi:hypothetical protein